MAKAKTSLRRKKFSENTPKLRLKKGVKLNEHDPFEALLDEQLIAQAFWDCLKENDPNGAMEIISAHLNALNKANISKSPIYHNLKSKNPTIKTVAKLIHFGI